ncbi:LysM peptidoglycan-binding domain-containing protein [Ectopseudomonas mendocina]|uniref:LysM peptidoglycan-binding domain-containing protein n=1 Tax=Ectopseudomonas mendocina TaxID=300 RepID=A0ABZ2RR19_ECTME
MPLSPSKPLNFKALAQGIRSLVVIMCVVLAGCQTTPEPPDSSRNTDLAVGLNREPEWLKTTARDAEKQPKDIWERVRSGYQLQETIGLNPRIEQQRLWFVSNSSFVEKAANSSSPYIHYIVERLEQHNMPTELALLPMIESAYNPMAYSRAHAVGLWQFIPSTGRNFNLRQTNWYDGRRDVTASTQAAIDYLSRLKEMFNGDWLLALAAYNAGEGRVSRAIERNEKLGLPTDYWNLSLPTETQNYVPKLLALSQVIMTPQAYGVSLAPIANEPYFEKVAFNQRMDLARVAKITNLDETELELLNPAYKRGVTHDGPKHLLVPADKAEQFSASLSLLKADEQVSWQEYRVRPGDSLHSIANRNQITVNTLKDINKLSSNNLSVGQLLSIPTEPTSRHEPLYQRRTVDTTVATSRPVTGRTYRVKDGDNLWQIAQRNNVKVSDIQRWNRLSGNSLRVGQVLNLHGSATNLAQQTRTTRQQPRQNVTYYRVRSGDSMYEIARRFNVSMSSLQNWNPKAGKSLRPGQTLTLYTAN